MRKPKWISNNQNEFLLQGEARARALLADPARFEISLDEAARFDDAMKQCRARFITANLNGRSKAQNAAFKEARADAVKLLQRIGNLVRTNPRIAASTKLTLGIEARAKPSGPIPCPQEPPHLWLVGALHHGISAEPIHELRYSAAGSTKSKPEGAVRLDFFVDFIGLNDPVPEFPMQIPVYVGAVNSSPFKFTPEMPDEPRIVLYWARWAGAGNFDFGPFCKTVVGGLVGGMRRFAGARFGAAINPRAKSPPILHDTNDNRDMTIRIAVLEMQRSMMLPQAMRQQTKQLEPPKEEAA